MADMNITSIGQGEKITFPKVKDEEVFALLIVGEDGNVSLTTNVAESGDTYREISRLFTDIADYIDEEANAAAADDEDSDEDDEDSDDDA